MNPVVAFYERSDEHSRMANTPLEYLRNQELIERALPRQEARVLDVGGATGAFSFWPTPGPRRGPARHSPRRGVVRGSYRSVRLADRRVSRWTGFGPRLRFHCSSGHRNRAALRYEHQPRVFTDAYLHRPDELLEEVREAGWLASELFAVTSFGWTIPKVAEKLQDPAYRDLLLSVIREVETRPELMGASSHLAAVARR